MNPSFHIADIVAESCFQKFNIDRFGIESCIKTVDFQLALELQTILNRALERKACGLESAIGCCPIEAVEEKIKTL